MAIDIQSLFNPGSLQDMAETEDERKKRAQLTGTMNLGGQSGTFTGTFDPSLFQQTNTSAPVGYQLPPNYGMSAPPEQQTLPVVPAPAPAPPVGTNPISGEYTAPPQPPADLPTYNQPYQIPPPVTGFDESMVKLDQPASHDMRLRRMITPPMPSTPDGSNGIPMQQPMTQLPPSKIYGGLTPGQALGGEFTMQQPVGPVAPEMIQPAPVQQPELLPSVGLDWYSYQDDQGRTVYNNGTPAPVQQPAPAPVQQPPPSKIYGGLTPGQALGGEFTMPSMEITPDFAAYQNYFNQMYNPATGSDQLPGQWAQLTAEQQYGYLGGSPFGQIGQGSQDLNLQMMNQKP